MMSPRNTKIILIKPQSMMNDIGKTIKRATRTLNIRIFIK